MQATAVGSLPGTEFDSAVRLVLDLFAGEGLVFVPELPGRGQHSAIVGRTLGLLDLPVDLLHGRWRLATARGRDARRAESLLRQDLDRLEAELEGGSLQLKQQLCGPFSVLAVLERQRGGAALGDHGLRREVIEALAVAVGEHTRELVRRFGPGVVVQIDEPSAPAVLAGTVPTASGWARFPGISEQEAAEGWASTTEAVRDAGGVPVVHCCAPEVPVSTMVTSGFEAISFDLSVAVPGDEWATALESGVGLWLGTDSPRKVEEFLGRLGFGLEGVVERLAVTPACGLAGLEPNAARDVLSNVLAVARSLTR